MLLYIFKEPFKQFNLKAQVVNLQVMKSKTTTEMLTKNLFFCVTKLVVF